MVAIDPSQDYYKVLEVAVDATPDEIRRSYRDLAKLYHPDTGHGDVERFRQIQEAYQVLYDVTYRAAYDHQRLSRGLGGTSSLVFGLLQSREEIVAMDEQQMLYVMADVQPHEGLKGARKNLNIALVIDRSTSMHGARMHNVKLAADDLIASLKPTDRLALVTFSDRAEVLISGRLQDNHHRFRSAVASITSGGGTEIYQGLAEALRLVEPHASPEVVSHIILLTDGRTYGDEALALAAAAEAARTGIGISAFGIGEDWNDLFLDDLASQGGGTSQYIDTPAKVQLVLKAQVRSLATMALRKLRIRVSTAPNVELLAGYRVAPYMEVLSAVERSVFPLGNLMSGEPSAIVMEFAIRLSGTGTRRVARFVVEGEDVAGVRPVQLWRDVHVTASRKPAEKPVPPRLLNTLARLSIFRLQERAWRALESGQSEQATHFLQSAATHLLDLGYRELGQAAMLEVARLAQGHAPTHKGRKQLRYGTRTLSVPSR